MRKVVIFACTMAAACAPLHSAEAGMGSTDLTGSRWRLVELQSMDDRQGITRPGSHKAYRLAFRAGGRLTVQLDCNRGTGRWQADRSGRLTIGPLATTRAMCPETSIAGRVGQDLVAVRSFQRKEGKLYLSLMVDGGIMVWEPEE